jgi:hypothetical protein
MRMPIVKRFSLFKRFVDCDFKVSLTCGIDTNFARRFLSLKMQSFTLAKRDRPTQVNFGQQML